MDVCRARMHRADNGGEKSHFAADTWLKHLISSSFVSKSLSNVYSSKGFRRVAINIRSKDGRTIVRPSGCVIWCACDPLNHGSIPISLPSEWISLIP
jgi:hypothetical protein